MPKQSARRVPRRVGAGLILVTALSVSCRKGDGGGSFLPPVLQGPVFESARKVSLRGLESDTSVQLFADGKPIGQAAVASSRQEVEAERPLKAGEELTARVVRGKENGQISEALTVQALPAGLDAPQIDPVLYAGAYCLGSRGGVPGGTAKVWIGAESLGSGDIDARGEALIILSRPLQAADQIEISQQLGGLESPKTPQRSPVPPAGPLPYSENLPPPILPSPVFAGQTIVGLAGLLPGGRFRVAVDGVEGEDHVSGKTVEQGLVPGALAAGQKLSLRQSLDGFGPSALSQVIEVMPGDMIPNPVLAEPIYDGDLECVVSRLQPSAQVELYVDGERRGLQNSGGESELLFSRHFRQGETVRAKQILAEQVTWSNTVEVTALPDNLAAPQLRVPLYAGAELVQVTGKLAGAKAKVYADGMFRAEGLLESIPIPLPLQAGQQITATQQVGQKTSPASQPVVVQELESLAAPVLETPIDACSGVCKASGLVPGGRLSIFSGPLLLGSVLIESAAMEYTLPIKPRPGWELRAIQSLGIRQSAESNIGQAKGSMAITHGLGASEPIALTPKVQVEIAVETRCPVLSPTTITLTPSNPTIVQVENQGAFLNPATIPAGQSRAVFKLNPGSLGAAQVSATASGYLLMDPTWSSADPGLDVLVKTP